MSKNKFLLISKPMKRRNFLSSMVFEELSIIYNAGTRFFSQIKPWHSWVDLYLANAVCDVVNSVCDVGNSIGDMANGVCNIANNICGVSNGVCDVVNSICDVSNDVCASASSSCIENSTAFPSLPTIRNSGLSANATRGTKNNVKIVANTTENFIACIFIR